jgi:hypothetical protein
MPRLSKAELYMKEFWWGGTPNPESPSKTAGEEMIATAKLIRDMNAQRVRKMLDYTQLYRDRRVSGFMPGDLHLDAEATIAAPLTYNVVKSCTDTVIAKLTMHEPSPNFSTFGATEDLQDRARGQEKLSVGVLQNEQGYDEARRVMRDACICPVGVMKVFDEKNPDRIRLKRIHPSKVLWDIQASIDSRRPTCFYEYDERSKADLMEQFPKHAGAIKEAPHVTIKKAAALRGKMVRELVEVFEAYKEGTPEVPGRHIIAIEGRTLLDEPWNEAAPYSFTRWGEDTLGFDGISIAQELEGIQEEINFVLDHLRGNHEVLGEGYYIKPKGAEVDDEALMSNERFRLVEYAGPREPKIEYPPIANPQTFQYLEQLYARAFELVGLSQLSATSKKPADLESGAALRAYLDVETVRFAVPQRAWEQLFVELAKQIVRCSRRIASRNPRWWVAYSGRDRMLQKIKWSEVAMDDDQFQIRVHPVSALPLQPAARLERAAELARDQLITPEQFKQLAAMPDLEKWQQLETAPMEDFERIFEKMLKPGAPYIKPLEFQELEIGIPLCQRYWSRAACDEAPEEVLDRLETWMVEARDLVEQKLQKQLALQQLEAQIAEMEQALAGPGPEGPAPEPPPGGPEQPPGEQLAA